MGYHLYISIVVLKLGASYCYNLALGKGYRPALRGDSAAARPIKAHFAFKATSGLSPPRYGND